MTGAKGHPGRFFKEVIMTELAGRDWTTISELYNTGFYKSKDFVGLALADLYLEGKLERRYDPTNPRRVWQYRIKEASE